MHTRLDKLVLLMVALALALAPLRGTLAAPAETVDEEMSSHCASMQHGDDMTLKRMKRRQLREDALRFTKEDLSLRPDMTFGADIIAGFPTETDAMFENNGLESGKNLSVEEGAS